MVFSTSKKLTLLVACPTKLAIGCRAREWLPHSVRPPATPLQQITSAVTAVLATILTAKKWRQSRRRINAMPEFVTLPVLIPAWYVNLPGALKKRLILDNSVRPRRPVPRSATALLVQTSPRAKIAACALTCKCLLSLLPLLVPRRVSVCPSCRWTWKPFPFAMSTRTWQLLSAALTSAFQLSPRAQPQVKDGGNLPRRKLSANHLISVTR